MRNLKKPYCTSNSTNWRHHQNNFPFGYGEENDFCFRVVDAGFDLAVMTNCYVYHAKSKSYSNKEREQLMGKGMKALLSKYTTWRIERSVSTMKNHPKLIEARMNAYRLYNKHAKQK